MQEPELIFNWTSFLVILFFGIVVAFLILLLVIPVKMANRRGRSGFGWFLLSLVISPLLCMLFLYFLGETEEKRKERIIDEERLRNMYRNPMTNPMNSENNLDKWLEKNPGKSINDYYYNR